MQRISLFSYLCNFVQAVAEIAKATKREAGELPNQAQSYNKDIDSGEYLYRLYIVMVQCVCKLLIMSFSSSRCA